MPVMNGGAFELGSGQRSRPVKQPEQAPVAAVGNGPGKAAAAAAAGGMPLQTSSDPADVCAFLHGGGGPSSLNVARWDTVDEEVVKRADAFAR